MRTISAHMHRIRADTVKTRGKAQVYDFEGGDSDIVLGGYGEGTHFVYRKFKCCKKMVASTNMQCTMILPYIVPSSQREFPTRPSLTPSSSSIPN